MIEILLTDYREQDIVTLEVPVVPQKGNIISHKTTYKVEQYFVSNIRYEVTETGNYLNPFTTLIRVIVSKEH